MHGRCRVLNRCSCMQTSTDFAYLPFGGGSRKCVGDQFAVLEAAVAFAMLVRRFNFDLADDPKDIKMTTGAVSYTHLTLPTICSV